MRLCVPGCFTFPAAVDAVLKIPAELRPVYTDTPARPLSVVELLANMQAARSRKILRPLGEDVVFTAAEVLLFAKDKCKQLTGEAATVRESTMLWCAFADLMAGVHALAPEDGSWWDLSWQVRAGDQAEEIANWINAHVRADRTEGPTETWPVATAASAETWPVMLTAAAVALHNAPPGKPVAPDAIVNVANDEKMHRYVKPRQEKPQLIREIECTPMVTKIAEIIAAALNANELAPTDQLLVLRATAAGICASTWHAPQVVRHALLPAVADLLHRGAPLHWMNQRQLYPSDIIELVLADRWQGYSRSW